MSFTQIEQFVVLDQLLAQGPACNIREYLSNSRHSLYTREKLTFLSDLNSVKQN